MTSDFTGQERRDRDDDRRQKDDPYKGAERRKEDRRELSYGVVFKTQESAAHVTDWLEHNCTGRWSLRFDGLDEESDKRKLRAAFDRQNDKRAFYENFVSRNRN